MYYYVRDDGSSDSTFDIINKWSKVLTIKLFKEKNVGPAQSFWTLLCKSEIQADYYAFCDQDDVWDSNKLEVAVNKLKEDYCLYFSNCRIIDEYGDIVKEERLIKEPDLSIKNLFISGITQGCSMVFTQKLRSEILNLNIQTIPMHDIVLMLYALFLGKIYYDSKPRFGYRIHSNNVVAKQNKLNIYNLKKTVWI